MQTLVPLDLLQDIDAEAFCTALPPAVYEPTPQKIRNILHAYCSDPMIRACAVKNDNRIAGIIGIRLQAPNAAEILHIAVLEEFRQRGMARAMIEGVISRFALNALIVETDRDAVDFYQRCGFAIQSLGEQYPGVERFQCKLRSKVD